MHKGRLHHQPWAQQVLAAALRFKLEVMIGGVMFGNCFSNVRMFRLGLVGVSVTERDCARSCLVTEELTSSGLVDQRIHGVDIARLDALAARAVAVALVWSPTLHDAARAILKRFGTLVVLMKSTPRSSSRPARCPAPRIPRYMQRAFADYLSSMARILSDTVNTCTMPHWVITLRPSCGAPRLVASRGCQALTRHFDAFEALFLLRGIIADCVPLIRSYVSYCTYFDHHILEIEWIRLCTHDSNQDSAAFTRSTCFEKDFVWNEHTCINTHFMNVTSHQSLFDDCWGKRDRITTFGDDSELGCEWDGWGWGEVCLTNVI